ncbi:hypothetical protein MZO42_16570 [Sphingomonas psychrotolerans]|uniref:Uncharacterized protein n=1 Tax=Sphingomonas psychrotolerans TaxID=1327635 RepID=A0ABU3N709_9SPHN|nr:hypothetical protein [Sphingomonas psychrotolerans]MDT8760317.1 hypothetical protein [Sphingomonas psychrotolerans]
MRTVAALTALLGLSGQAAPLPHYAQGQIWEYRARPRDPGSVLKIQRIEALGSMRVYHISVANVHFGTSDAATVLPHSPVSEETLNASVVRLAPATTAFPTVDFEAGIAEWRRAKGGVFTTPVSEIVGLIDSQLGK